MSEVVSSHPQREGFAPGALARQLLGPAGDSSKQPAPPGGLDSQVAQGTTLARQGRRQEAIALFRRVIGARPDHTQAHYNLGVALAEEKRFAEALACFREAVRCQPHFPEAHCALGNTFGELGRDEEAVADYHEAIRHKPDFVDALHNLGVALTRLRRGPEAAIFLLVSLQKEAGREQLGQVSQTPEVFKDFGSFGGQVLRWLIWGRS